MNSQLATSTTTTNTDNSSRPAGGAARVSVPKTPKTLYRLVVKRERAAETTPRYCGTALHNPSTVARIAATLLGNEDQEVFLAFFLDAKNRIAGYSEIARGALESCPVDPRILFRAALLVPSCVSLIVAHNHPSQDPTPSAADNHLTGRLSQAGSMIGIPVLDHIVVAGDDTWHSYAEQGDMPSAAVSR
jgi:DNA repair protein RadC